MPPRWLCVVVIVFWLATTGWLVWNALRDEFGADEPPPFVIDLVDEAQPERFRIRWRVWQGEEPPLPVRRMDLPDAVVAQLTSPPMGLVAGAAAHACLASSPPGLFSITTWLEHHEQPDDSFSLHVRFQPDEAKFRHAGAKHMDFGFIKLKRMASAYRVNRAGRLLATKADFDLDMPGVNNLSIGLEGEMRGGLFHSRFVLSRDDIPVQEKELDPVPVSRRGSVLLPMHPVNRIRGLRPGRTWTMPLVNPLADAVGGLIGKAAETRTLRARVLPELQELPNVSEQYFGPWKPVPCLVIEYDGDEEGKPRTWVRAADGLVLRQDAFLLGQRLVMQRDLIPDVINEP